MISTGISQLRQAFNAHLCASEQSQGMASNLLLFYAAECGIKSIWLRRNRLRTTDDISDQTLLSKDGHNLDRWRKELRISASQVSEAPHFRLARDSSSLDVEKAHQAWRYGIRMNSQDEKDLVKWLENLCHWIKENIKR
ncbi:MAG: hypothetical protein F6J86_23630 [Symploca sp. SIO1B1]|nr:hypothetical protein [Symploca sp. SIO1B1]